MSRDRTAEGVNAIAATVSSACGFVPLSVRYDAAHAALGVVEAWKAAHPMPVQDVLDKLTEDDWKVATWVEPPSNYVIGHVDGADRRLIVERIFAIVRAAQEAS